MPIAQHPTAEDLSAFLANTLDVQSEHECNQHFEQCSECCRALEQLCNADQSLEKRIRQIHANTTIGLSAGTTFFSFNSDEVTTSPLAEHESELVDRDGRYHFESEMARGGMGVVYSGRDELLNRGLVLKVLHPKARNDEDAIERFVSEAKIGGGLQHPGIVPIHDLGTLSDNRPFFSMRRIEGQSLDAILADRSNAADDQVRLLNILTQVCQTVAYAHSQNIVHRDLKPQNVMVGRFGEVQVVDWGIAKQLNATETRTDKDDDHFVVNGSETRFGQVLGTPTYMPPEQATGDVQRIDKRTDVFALGAVLYEILTGQPIYNSAQNGAESAIDAAATCDLSSAFAYLDSFTTDRELIAFCKQCLSVDPADRPSDANCVARALIDHAESNSQRLRRAELFAERQRTVYDEKNKRRMIIWGSVAAIAFLCSLIALGYAFFTQRHANLASSLSRNLDAYDRAIELASIYPQGELTAMLEAFDEVESVRSSRTEIQLHTRGESLSETDAELCRRLLDAHIWTVTSVDDPLRSTCLAEAARAYNTTFSVFTEWSTPRSMSIEKAASAIRSKPEFVQQTILAAIDDYMILGKRPASEAMNWEWLSSIGQEIDTNALRSQIRRGIREFDRPTLENLSTRIDLGKQSPATIYLVVVGLRLVGSDADAISVLASARKLHPDAFWLNGRIVSSDYPRSSRGADAPMTRDIFQSDSEQWDSTDNNQDTIEVVFAARANTRAKQYQLALEQFQWVFRNIKNRTQRLDPLLENSQLATVLQFWNELGQRHTIAAQELTELREACKVLVTDIESPAEQRKESFRVFASINRVLSQRDKTVALFKTLANDADALCSEVFEFAEQELVAGDKPLLAKFRTAYADALRDTPRLESVTPSPAMGSRRDQFAAHLTWIAMLTRKGHHADANAVAKDAKRFWEHGHFIAEIDAALEGVLPAEASLNR